ncbi:MAG TPA: shikimate kinase, partial [Spirochaetia bacterium]|nr:shikimate kinase [Spirochaetia bacterium]
MVSVELIDRLSIFPITLMGMKHSGKTTLGKRLAQAWSLAFQDLDDLVIAEYLRGGDAAADGMGPVGIRDVFRALGATDFKKVEARAATALVAAAAAREFRIVSALGGGTIENEPAMNILSSRGTLVYLEAEAAVLFRRIMRGGVPAFLDPTDPERAFNELYEKRTRLYR